MPLFPFLGAGSAALGPPNNFAQPVRTVFVLESSAASARSAGSAGSGSCFFGRSELLALEPLGCADSSLGVEALLEGCDSSAPALRWAFAGSVSCAQASSLSCGSGLEGGLPFPEVLGTRTSQGFVFASLLILLLCPCFPFWEPGLLHWVLQIISPSPSGLSLSWNHLPLLHALPALRAPALASSGVPSFSHWNHWDVPTPPSELKPCWKAATPLLQHKNPSLCMHINDVHAQARVLVRRLPPFLVALD